MDAQHIISDALALAKLRSDGMALAVVGETFLAGHASLPADPEALWLAAAHGRCLLAPGADEWLLAEGCAYAIAGDGPGRAAGLAQAATWFSAALAASSAALAAQAGTAGPPIAPPLLTAWRFAESAFAPDGVWTGVPGWRMWLPARCRWRRADGSACSWRATVVHAGESAPTVLARLRAEPQPSPLLPAQPWPPVPGNLAADLGHAIDWLDEGAARKVVWATAHDLAAPNRPIAAVMHAARSGGSCAFAYDLPDGALFAGATPELLVAVHGDELRTVALAGTVARSADPARDAANIQALLTATKERKEHNLVVEHMITVLRGRAETFMPSERPELRSLRTLHHLATPIQVRLRSRVPLEVAAALHPTPAVAGLPVAIAQRHLLRHEGFDRGLYAGAMGWISGGDVRLWVLIRGAVIRGAQARAMAGAGLVEASDAHAEAGEIQLKLKAIADLIGSPWTKPA